MVRHKRNPAWHRRSLRFQLSNILNTRRRSIYLLRFCGFVIIILIIVLLHKKQHENDGNSEIHFSPDPFYSGANESKDILLEGRGYLVWSPSCRIPERKAFDKSILRFLEEPQPIICSDKQPLTYVAPENESMQGNYVLHIDESTIPSYVSIRENVSCCYSNITRVNIPPGQDFDENVDNRINISLCGDFEKKVKLLPGEEFILVRCKRVKIGEEDQEIYINMHGVVPIKKIVKGNRRKRKIPDDDNWLNVLILAYDSVSQLNLIRTMPSTVQYLNEAGFVNLYGYNIVGDTTFPNIMAMLTGLSLSLMKQECGQHKFSAKINLDECPFLWKDYNEFGYVTAYIADTMWCTFNLNSIGFGDPPTDYYFRPYILAADKHLVKKKKKYCFGPEPTTDHVMKYLLNFVSTFRNYLYFALVWMSNFSHDLNDINQPRAMDQRTLQFFHDLNRTNIYNNTLVIFMSDHGTRLGKMRETFQGWLEERLPYAYFLFPEWYRKKNAQLYKNLLTNRKRLTSHYDLYVTLKNLLSIPQNTKFDNTNVCSGCPHCKSLFLQDFGDRTCEEAGIIPGSCSCNLQFTEIPTNDTNVVKAVKYIMHNIQKKLKENIDAQLCSNITVKDVVKAKLRLNEAKRNVGYHYDYLIIFETQPGKALFESIVQYFTREKQFSLFGHIKRINSYGNQSECVNDHEMKLYCYCRKLF